MTMTERALQIKKGKGPKLKPSVKAKFYEHQQIAFDLCSTLPSVGLFMEAGTGKTLPVIASMGYRLSQGYDKVLIVCSNILISSWVKQIDKFADFKYKIILLPEGTQGKIETINSLGLINKDKSLLKIILVNYESTWRMENTLLKWNPDSVIVDESHHIKNPRAKQTRCIMKLGKKAKSRVIMTGTPITQSPANIFSQIGFLDNEVFGRSFVRFKETYAVMGGYQGKQIIGWKVFKEINGKRNKYYNKRLSEEYSEKFHSMAYCVTKKELREKGILMLPEETVEYRYTRLEPQALKYSKDLEKKFVANLPDNSSVVSTLQITSLLRMAQICGGFIKPTHIDGIPDEGQEYIQVSSAKLNLLKEVCLEISEYENKFIIFCLFREEIKAIEKLLNELGITNLVLQGGIKNPGQVVEIFEEQKTHKALICQIKTGKEGITLNSADHTIFYSYDSSVEAYQQARARTHRIGQDKSVRYIFLIAEDTVDEKNLMAIENNIQLANLTTHDLKILFENKKEREIMAKLNKEADKLMENIPGPENGYEQELNSILDQIEKDLENSKPVTREWTEPRSSKKKKKKKTIRQVTVNFNGEGPKTVQTGTKTLKQDNSISNEQTAFKDPKKAITQDGEIITLKELAGEKGVEPKDLRKWCRKNLGERPSGRWEWDEGDPDIEKIRNAKV